MSFTGFKKRAGRKNIRERKVGGSDDEDTIGYTKLTTEGTKKAPPTKSGLLSFEDEVDEGVEFKVKKTSLSEKTTKEKERIVKRKQKQQLLKQQKQEEVVISSDEEEEQDTSVIEQLHVGVVPDAKMIHAIRKKRELARKMGVASVDYLPLEQETKKGYGAVSGNSRLIREDENDLSDEDEGMASHMTFGKKTEPARQMEVLTALENVDSNSEDEETKRWEEEQISKGIKASNAQPESKTSEPSITSLDPLTQSFIYGTSEQYWEESYVKQTTLNEVNKVNSRPPVRVPAKLVPITLETLKSKLSTRLQEMKEDLANHTKQLEQVQNDLEEANKVVEGAELHYPKLEREYLFYQQMRGYLRDLLSCLAIKAPTIKRLELKVQDIFHQQSFLLIERRRQDVRDESEECLGTNEGCGPESEARQRRSVEREARRRRRRETRQRQEILKHDEGLSSDDEFLETDRLKFIADQDALREDIKTIFNDVVEDFHQLEVIKARFEQWKFYHPDSYQQAYVSMCLPKLFAPYVRYEMLHWNPLNDTYPPIESMTWFQNLLFYAYQEGVEPSLSDDDTHLIPQVIDRVIITKLTSLVQRVWDPLSKSQTQRLIKIMHTLNEEYPTVSSQTKNLEDLKTAIVKRQQEMITEDIFIPLMTKSQLEATNTPSYLFYQRQFWKTVKLLGNIVCWQGILPADILQRLTLDGLINRYLLLSLQNSPVDELTVRKLESIIHQLPQDWSVSKCKGLINITRYLTHLSETFERTAMSYNVELHKKNTIQLQERIIKLQKILIV